MGWSWKNGELGRGSFLKGEVRHAARIYSALLVSFCVWYCASRNRTAPRVGALAYFAHRGRKDRSWVLRLKCPICIIQEEASKISTPRTAYEFIIGSVCADRSSTESMPHFGPMSATCLAYASPFFSYNSLYIRAHNFNSLFCLLLSDSNAARSAKRLFCAPNSPMLSCKQ